MGHDYDRAAGDDFFEEIHGELFGRNIFVLTMIGAVAFVGMSAWYMI